MSRHRQQRPLRCPFCRAEVNRPEIRFDLYTPEGSLAGACGCGALFVVDDTGRQGGQALLDLQALACDGDLDAALKLESGRDIEIRDMPLSRRTIREILPRGAYTYIPPRVWFGRLKRGT